MFQEGQVKLSTPNGADGEQWQLLTARIRSWPFLSRKQEGNLPVPVQRAHVSVPAVIAAEFAGFRWRGGGGGAELLDCHHSSALFWEVVTKPLGEGGSWSSTDFTCDWGVQSTEVKPSPCL